MKKTSSSNRMTDEEKENLWGKYVEIKLKDSRTARGLVITQAGDSISISDEFKNLEEYQNYKPEIMGSCGVVYPHTEGYKWSEIDRIEVVL
ncbi:MAG: hypothetical protein HY739_08280 [Desulfobacterales bacterium]|nr:hypothetical protein [Desulfobacterales bacterium]